MPLPEQLGEAQHLIDRRKAFALPALESYSHPLCHQIEQVLFEVSYQ